MKNREIARLVKRVKEQDKNAFVELYNHLWQSVYYIVFKQVKNHEDATDLTQEIFLKVSRQIHTLKNDAAFNAWINTIITNHCNTYLYSNRKKDEISIDEVDEESLFEYKREFLPEEILSSQELRQAVSDIVSELPIEQRQAILFYYYNDLSAKEISKILGTTPNAVNIKLSRGRAAIKSKVEALQRKGIMMYSIATVPVLTRILTLEAKQICAITIRDQILSTLQASMAAEMATAGAAQTSASAAHIGFATAKPLIVKIGVSILTVAMIGGAAVGGLYLINNPASNAEPQNQITASDPVETAELDKSVTELEDFVGEQDAATIRSWGVLSTENNDEQLLEIAERHGFVCDNGYFKADSFTDGIYILFWLEKQDKRLLLCEYYNAETLEWGVAYCIEEIVNPIPQQNELKTFFTEHIAAGD